MDQLIGFLSGGEQLDGELNLPKVLGAIGTKTITENGTYDASDDGYDGYSQVTANVPNTYTAGDEGKVVDNGALVSQTSATYTSNNTYDTTKINSVTVNVSGGSTPTLETVTKTYTPSTSQQTDTITPGIGYDAIGEVDVTVNAMPTGTEGTPTATKGAVSNHSVAVTPSVTNQAGYIAGGTKTGTAVTVSASELVSGTKQITQNGTGIDVTEYAAVDVNVSGGGGTPISGGGVYVIDSSESISMDAAYNGELEVSKNPVLTNSWDFKTGLTDSVGGLTATLANGATRDSTGLLIAGATQYCSFPIKYSAYKTYEIDVTSVTKNFSSGHGRLFMITNGEGLILQNGSTWNIYMDSGWCGSMGTNQTIFNGKTIRICTGRAVTRLLNGTSTLMSSLTIYIDNVLWAQTQRFQQNTTSNSSLLSIGSSSQSLANLLVTGFRIYDGCKY